LEKAKLQAPDQFGELCVSEFHWDEFEIDSKGDADDYVRHLEPALRVAIAAPELLDVYTILAEDCRMALSGEWDKSNEGFQESLDLLESVIAKATGGAV
jgi:hypothetical protein